MDEALRLIEDPLYLGVLMIRGGDATVRFQAPTMQRAMFCALLFIMLKQLRHFSRVGRIHYDSSG